MINNLNDIISTNAKGMKRSAIRELLKLTNNPEIISFAGGLPSPDSFPVEQLNEVICDVMKTEPQIALQYGATEGDPLLRKYLVEYYRKLEGLDITEENLIIVTASQQALDLVAKIFVDPGDKVIVSLPSYLGGLQAFHSYGADLVGINTDHEGMLIDELEDKLTALNKIDKKPKFIYTIPDFQNPDGITMSKQRRLDLIQVAKKHDVLIVEDSPYRELRFEGESIPTIYSLDNSGQVITLGTFSKTFTPGFRLGWVIAHPEVVDKFVVAKQSTDLCSPPFCQRIVARFLQKGYLQQNIEKIKIMYREKRDILNDLFKKNMPEGVSWTVPEGGLFLFVTLPEHMDAKELFKKAIENKVAFVPGVDFFCNGGGKNTFRMNFSYSSIEQLKVGCERLAQAIKDMA